MLYIHCNFPRFRQTASNKPFGCFYRSQISTGTCIKMHNTLFFNFFFSFLVSFNWAFSWQKLEMLSSATCHAKMSLFTSSQASSKIYRCLGLFPSCKTSLYKQEQVNAKKLPCLLTEETWLQLLFSPSIRDSPNVLALHKSDTKSPSSFISFEGTCEFLSPTFTEWTLFAYLRNNFSSSFMEP